MFYWSSDMNKFVYFYLLVAALLLFSGSAYAQDANNFVVAVAKQGGVPEAQAEQQINSVFAAVQTELQAGREVQIRKFGKFYVQSRDSRKGRNPRTGQAIDIPARKYPRFSAAESLRETVNKVQ